MGFELFSAVTPFMSRGRPDLNFDTLMAEPVAKWRERVPGSAPQRTPKKRLVAS
ncbi:hypothetical protein X741_18875 [Mesorhizobium sp. LNHC229A00]|nr:hypothetical protein X741_18875 [Mesorhizobium sp. LNHC229A00]